VQGATLIGTNYGALSLSASAHADLATIHADLLSRSATPIISALDATTIYPGVWTCANYLLGNGATVTFDARNNPNAVFIMLNSGKSVEFGLCLPRSDCLASVPSGYLDVNPNGAMLLSNGAQASFIFVRTSLTFTCRTAPVYRRPTYFGRYKDMQPWAPRLNLWEPSSQGAPSRSTLTRRCKERA